jgi:hypothetical protein
VATYENLSSLLPYNEAESLVLVTTGPLEELEGSSAVVEKLTQDVLGNFVKQSNDCVLYLDIVATVLFSKPIPLAQVYIDDMRVICGCICRQAIVGVGEWCRKAVVPLVKGVGGIGSVVGLDRSAVGAGGRRHLLGNVML